MTGVQTCALPIYKKTKKTTHGEKIRVSQNTRNPNVFLMILPVAEAQNVDFFDHEGDFCSRPKTTSMFISILDRKNHQNYWRSEERRGGKEGRARWAPEH